MAAPVVAVAMAEDPLSAAQRVFDRHTRRLYPDTGRCICGGAWLVQGTDGSLVEGCAVRTTAAGLLANRFGWQAATRMMVRREMPGPVIDPSMRPAGEIPPANSYSVGARVWVFCGGAWCPGRVEGASERAATVTYRPAGRSGTAVDTVTAGNLVGRIEDDDVVDHSGPLPARGRPSERQPGAEDRPGDDPR